MVTMENITINTSVPKAHGTKTKRNSAKLNKKASQIKQIKQTFDEVSIFGIVKTIKNKKPLSKKQKISIGARVLALVAGIIAYVSLSRKADFNSLTKSFNTDTDKEIYDIANQNQYSKTALSYILGSSNDGNTTLNSNLRFKNFFDFDETPLLKNINSESDIDKLIQENIKDVKLKKGFEEDADKSEILKLIKGNFIKLDAINKDENIKNILSHIDSKEKLDEFLQFLKLSKKIDIKFDTVALADKNLDFKRISQLMMLQKETPRANFSSFYYADWIENTKSSVSEILSFLKTLTLGNLDKATISEVRLDDIIKGPLIDLKNATKFMQSLNPEAKKTVAVGDLATIFNNDKISPKKFSQKLNKRFLLFRLMF